MTDWLQETYDRSPNKCQLVDPNHLYKLAELMAEFSDTMGFEECLEELKDPFLTNIDPKDKDLYLSAAKMSGVTIKFGPAKNGGEDRLGLFSADKAKYDLCEFWARYQEIKRHNVCGTD